MKRKAKGGRKVRQVFDANILAWHTGAMYARSKNGESLQLDERWKIGDRIRITVDLIKRKAVPRGGR